MAGGSASIKDVAAMAGVSHQTVSRVLNRPETVAPKTRARVERAMKALGFRPNAAARALRTRRSRTVGVLVASSSMFVALDGLSHLESTLRTAGLRMLITGLQGDDRAAAEQSVAPLLDYDVDALVIAANQRAAADLARELARTWPVVAMQPGVSAADGLSSAAVDLAAGVGDAVEHFVAGGARVLDFVPGPGHLTTVQARTDAWIRELGARELPLRPLVPAAMTVDGGYLAGLRLLDHGLPDAILCVNDLVAIGVLRALREHGVSVPQDVAVIGTDNFFTTDQISPSLTTIEQPLAELGRATGQLVVDALAGRAPQTVRLRPRLIVRESSPAPAPTDRPASGRPVAGAQPTTSRRP